MNRLEEIEQRIAQEIKTTKAAVAQYRELTKPIAPENAIGRVSRMDAINNKSVNEAALRKAETKLNNLHVALAKVNDSDFGLCRTCNKAIPIGRILLMPHTTSCVNCAR